MNELCDHSFYTERYLNGRTSRIPQEEFPHYALMATKEIVPYLGNGVPEALPDELKCCLCEVAELLYSLSASNTGRGVTSERVGDLSVSYESLENIEKAMRDGIKKAVLSWLSATDLLYRGVL